MSITVQGSFLFHGSAFGLSARFEHPSKATIPTQAMAILSPTGGDASSRVGPFNDRDVMFEEASARVSGSQDADGSRHADATAMVRKLRFLHFVEADMVFVRVNSIHNVRETREGIVDEADVNFGNSNVEGLVVSGQTIDITWERDVFSRAGTFERFRKDQPKQGKTYAHGGVKDGILVTSIVQSINNVQPLSDRERKNLSDPQYMLPGLRSDGNVLWVPHFGKIFIGEVIIQRGLRRINMLRIELGCGTLGAAALGVGEGNGGDIPPAP